MKNTQIYYQDWGLAPYQQAWDRQRATLDHILALKAANLQAAEQGLPAQPTPGWLYLCEHPPVYTLGKHGKLENLLLNGYELAERGIEYYQIERGGDITYHGPGQLTGYPVIDMENYFTDLGRFVRALEEAVIRTLAHYGLEAGRLEGYPGVWLAAGTPAPRKIAAVGIKCSRWVTMHGFALNVNPNLGHFGHIVPCGLAGKGVTSIAAELGQAPPMADVKAQVCLHLADLFGWQYTAEPAPALLAP